MFLIDKFQQFYGEVLKLQARVTAGAWIFSGESVTESAAKESPSAVWRRLVSILERQSLDAGLEGGDFAVEIYRRAQYAMAALADEVFLNLEWAGRDAWREHLLEAKFFGTHRAGEEMFERIEELLRDHDSLYAELGRVYLMVLALGFQGKYRSHPAADESLQSYRKRLFRFVYNRDPVAVYGNERVVPQAYSSTLDAARSTELPYLRPWIWATVLAFVVWIGGTWAIFRYSISDLIPMVQEMTSNKSKSAPATTTTTTTSTTTTATTATEERR
jgi:type VI secretion system protein ImpK